MFWGFQNCPWCDFIMSGSHLIWFLSFVSLLNHVNWNILDFDIWLSGDFVGHCIDFWSKFLLGTKIAHVWEENELLVISIWEDSDPIIGCYKISQSMVDPVDGQYLHHHFPSDQVVGVKQVCHLVNAIISKNSFYLYYSNVKINPLSWIRFFLIFSIKSWSNFKITDSFVIYTFSAVQNCPWFWNLTKIWWRNWGKTESNWVDWFWL